MDEASADGNHGSLVVDTLVSLVIGVHRVTGTAVDERALGERIFVADGEDIALHVVSVLISLVFGIHVADEGLGRTAEGGNVSADSHTVAIVLNAKRLANLRVLKGRDCDVGILEVLASNVELGNAEVVVTTEADGQRIFNILLAEGLDVRLGDDTGEVEVASREGRGSRRLLRR